MKQILITLLLLTAYSSTSAENLVPSSTLDVAGCSNGEINFFKKNILPRIKKENIKLEKTYCIDANFDGYKDILAIHMPVGITQNTDVYLFEKDSGEFIKSNELSNLPCLNIDKNNAIISGECFTASMCEHHTERYQFINNKLELIRIEGSYCDPLTGEAYEYIENYRNGKIIEDK